MRVVVITHAYPRWDGDVAGAFIERLCVALSARGHQLHVIAPADEGRGGRDRRCGIPVERVRYAQAHEETLAYRGTMAEAVRTPAGLFRFLSLLRALSGAALTEAHAVGAQVLHAHWWIPGGIAARRAHSAGGPPYVVTLHGTDVRILRAVRFSRPLGRRVLRRAAAVTAVSSYLAHEARAMGLRDEVTVHPMPAALSGITPSPGGGGIVTVGRLTKQKRLGLLLDALALQSPERSMSLTVVGDGPERAALETRARDLGLASRVRFLGTVPPPEVAEAIRHADVFAFPARHEGFGLAAAEALVLGVPVVAMEDGGGVLDFVTSEAGRVVPPEDPEALATALGALATDPEARSRAARAGATLVRTLSADSVASTFETIYRNIVA